MSKVCNHGIRQRVFHMQPRDESVHQRPVLSPCFGNPVDPLRHRSTGALTAVKWCVYRFHTYVLNEDAVAGIHFLRARPLKLPREAPSLCSNIWARTAHATSALNFLLQFVQSVKNQ